MDLFRSLCVFSILKKKVVQKIKSFVPGKGTCCNFSITAVVYYCFKNYEVKGMIILRYHYRFHCKISLRIVGWQFLPVENVLGAKDNCYLDPIFHISLHHKLSSLKRIAMLSSLSLCPTLSATYWQAHVAAHAADVACSRCAAAASDDAATAGQISTTTESRLLGYCSVLRFGQCYCHLFLWFW